MSENLHIQILFFLCVQLVDLPPPSNLSPHFHLEENSSPIMADNKLMDPRMHFMSSLSSVTHHSLSSFFVSFRLGRTFFSFCLYLLVPVQSERILLLMLSVSPFFLFSFFPVFKLYSSSYCYSI